ncbi:MAG: adenylosuccinate lyase [Chloroflexi bacterium RBG_19FT_COMBO_48_23]|nr:MAG: adenylosuccinate lyase [Chloroflexi bacterium RBG_19FT_COMBO_48_23]
MIERYSRPQMKKTWSEDNKFDKWLQVEIAVCEAWADVGVIPKESIPKIKKARVSLERVAEILKVTHHDVTAFLQAVAEGLGEESRFIHLGLTSSDVIDTALSLQLKEAAKLLAQGIDELISVLTDKAIEHKHTIMIGRTHGVHAEPITFGLKLAIWTQEMKRNAARLTEAEKAISVGKISGAVGTYATVPPEVEEKACTRLGLVPAPISSQIIQRDRHAQFVTTLAIIASSLEKFATEIRSLQRTEVLEAEEPFAAGQTGSSAMPHKRNPELCERVCGLARLVRGYALTSMENIALWHERDISHSSNERITLPDSCLVLDYILHIFTSVMRGLQVYPENMRRNLEITQGLVFSQRVLIALINKGLSRQEAYKLVQRNAMKAWKEKTSFLKLLKADTEVTRELSDSELESLFDYQYFTRYVDKVFQRLDLTEKKRPKSAKAAELAPQAL